MTNDKKIHKDLKRYFREIGRLLPRRIKKKLLTDLKREISVFVEGNPDTDYKTVVDHFGAPKDVANAFLSQETATVNKIHKCLKITMTVLLILAVIFIFWVCAVIKENNERIPIREGGDVSESLTIIS